MLDSLQPIYETLHDSIIGVMGNDLPIFSKGFVKGELGFPYMFLDQPETSPLRAVSSPGGYQYQVAVPLVVLNDSEGDTSIRFFGGNMKGTVGILQVVASRMWNTYYAGLPFQPPPDGWHAISWVLGGIERPRTPQLQEYLQNPYIEGASIPFIFEVQEYSPI